MGRGPSIEGRKNAEDARRGKLFTKLIREITIAARDGADPAGNPRLRIAMDKALSSNMTKDTVERAIKRGSGEGGADALQEIRYEGYGPGGVAVIVDAATDNPTRTVAEVRHAFSKCGGNLGTSGSVAFQFTRLGQIVVDLDGTDEERVLEVALEAGADDVVGGDDRCEVLSAPDAFEAVKAAIDAAGLRVIEADIKLRPNNRAAVSGETAEALEKMLAMLEELDDVQDVHHNADLPAARDD
jgi:YebC/PmpR family DNA-binding regulatory protein